MRLVSGWPWQVPQNDEPTLRRGGRPRSGPIGLLPPEVVPITAAQRETAIQSLAVLLDSWLNQRTHATDRNEGLRQPNTLSGSVPAPKARVRQA